MRYIQSAALAALVVSSRDAYGTTAASDDTRSAFAKAEVVVQGIVVRQDAAFVGRFPLVRYTIAVVDGFDSDLAGQAVEFLIPGGWTDDGTFVMIPGVPLPFAVGDDVAVALDTRYDGAWEPRKLAGWDSGVFRRGTANSFGEDTVRDAQNRLVGGVGADREVPVRREPVCESDSLVAHYSFARGVFDEVSRDEFDRFVLPACDMRDHLSPGG